MIKPLVSTMPYDRASALYLEAQTPWMANAVACALMLGNGVEPDPGFAVDLLRAGCGDGDPISMVNLARCYAYGLGVPVDYHACRSWLTKASEAGDPTAISELIALLACGVFGVLEHDAELRSEVLGWGLRLMTLDPQGTDFLRETLPELIETTPPEQVEAGFIKHGRPTYH